MKIKKTELDVDFIGGEPPLTKEEDKAIRDYINSLKQSASKKETIKNDPAKTRAKAIA